MGGRAGWHSSQKKEAMMRPMTWGALFVLSLIWSTVATGKELSPVKFMNKPLQLL